MFNIKNCFILFFLITTTFGLDNLGDISFIQEDPNVRFKYTNLTKSDVEQIKLEVYNSQDTTKKNDCPILDYLEIDSPEGLNYVCQHEYLCPTHGNCIILNTPQLYNRDKNKFSIDGGSLQGKNNQTLIVLSCDENRRKKNKCQTETCKENSDCFSNNCKNGMCMTNKDNPIYHCLSSYDEEKKEGSVKCLLNYQEKCKKDNECTKNTLCNCDHVCNEEYPDNKDTCDDRTFKKTWIAVGCCASGVILVILGFIIYGKARKSGN